MSEDFYANYMTNTGVIRYTWDEGDFTLKPKKSNSSFLYLAVMLLLSSIAIAFFVQSSFFTIERIDLAGLTTIAADDINQLGAGALGQNLIFFDDYALERNIKLHPLVKDVSFKRKIPHTLLIRIEERTPVALVNVPDGVIEIDREGFFLRRLEEWSGSYPVINGVEVPDTAGPGQALTDKNLAVAIKILGQAPQDLISTMGEIYINTVQQASLYLTSGIEVRLGHTESWETKLTSLLELINDPEFIAVEKSIRYIDFTAAKPVIGR